MDLSRLKIKKNIHAKFIQVDKKNIEFLQAICSKSGNDQHELYLIGANKYITCLQVFDFMENSYSGFMNNIIDFKNVVVSCDLTHEDKLAYDEKFGKIIEKHQKIKDATKKIVSYKRASKDVKEIILFDNHIEETADTVNYITLRIYIYDNSLEALQSRVDDIVNALAKIKMKGYIQTNDLSSDMRALTQFDNSVKKMVSSSTVADLLMRSEVNIVEKNIALIGYTSNGNYAPHIFSFTNYSYNKLILSGMGGGKSALLKSMCEAMLLRGNHVVHIFDIHNEYHDFANRLGIPVIGINEDNKINIAQIFLLEDGEIIQRNDIQNKVSAIVGTFETMNEITNKRVLKQLSLLLDEMYKPYLGRDINTLKNNDWFILSQVLDYLAKRIDDEAYKPVEDNDIYELKLGLRYMIENYGYIFDNITTMDFDLTNSAVFDISYFKNDSNSIVKSSYITLMLDYVSQATHINLERNKKEMKRLNVKPYQLDEPIFTYELIIDETMQYVDNRNFVERVLSFMKFFRKAYCGITMVFHTTDDTQKSLKDNGDLLSQLFELCTNKFIGYTEGKSLGMLPKLITQVNERDTEIIAKFTKGENDERKFLVCDDRKRKIIMTSIVSPFQREYFGGGS